ncbi:MAG TPA: serine/threonine-protein kinase [Thermoanaerobaculia bacterium]|nr:serine/threonine-protein kinase [Thermoanaerobaculia bacterium]
MAVLAKEIEATYEVLSKMGEGGMGAVYKVRHRFFDEIRVIKIMQGRLEPSDSLKERFLGEAKRGKQLRHPNLAEVLDFSIAADGTAYIVMEYIEGVNLRELMRNGGPLDAGTLVPIAEQALEALGFLHSKKFVHRDISPDNLMLTTGPDNATHVKLIDLGIAKSLESNLNLTMAGTFVGKVQYASPEQFGGQLSARSDIYSLGVVLYELLTGAKPFIGTDPMSIVRGHLTLPPRPFEETDPEGRVPPALRAVILKALAKKPEERFQTDAEFAEALRGTVRPRDLKTLSVRMPAVTVPGTTLVDVEARTAVAKTAVDGSAATVVSGEIPSAVRGRRARATYGIAAAVLVLLVSGAVLWQRAKDDAPPPVTETNTMAATATGVNVEAPVTAAPAPGRLLINALPWGQVTSVTDAAGTEQLTSGLTDTPLVLSLAPGAYKVTLANPNSKRSVVLDATVTSNALARCEAVLDRVDADAYVERVGIGR